MREGTLVVSTTQGRFALDDAAEGPELTSGQRVKVRLAGRWISGHVEHVRRRGGYCFFTDAGDVYPLQAGMQVRL